MPLPCLPHTPRRNWPPPRPEVWGLQP